MRTRLDIADDVLQAVKERAKHDRKTIGEVISDLARRGGIVNNELIDTLRDEDAFSHRSAPRTVMGAGTISNI